MSAEESNGKMAVETNSPYSPNSGSGKEDETSNPMKDPVSMADIPPEVVIDILEYLVMLERNRNRLLSYRTVNSLWKNIIDPLLERKIISDHICGFPNMRFRYDSDPGRPTVRNLPEIFSLSPKPFPFNALVISRNENKRYPFFRFFLPTDPTWVDIDDFMQRFAGSLTSYEIKNMVVNRKQSGFTLFKFMPSLKILSLMNVRLNYDLVNANSILPYLWPLPNLTSLKISSNHDFAWQENMEKSNILFVYVVATYADQLVSLSLNTVKSLPPLQQQNEYNHQLGNNRRLRIAGTTARAFTKLKELKLYRPSRNFLVFSNFPKLQKLSLGNLFRENVNHQNNLNEYPHDIQDIAVFINKFRNTLKFLRLDATWKQLIGERGANQYRLHGTMPPAICGTIESPFTMLRSLEIHYPKWYCEDLIMGSFISFFPTLKELHLMYFPSLYIATLEEIEMVNQAIISNAPTTQFLRIDELKVRLTVVKLDMIERSRSYNELRSELLKEPNRKLLPQITNDMREFTRAKKRERDSIFYRLAALGHKKQDVVVEQLLQSQNIYSTCPDLDLITINSSGERNGDVSVIRKPVQT